MGSSILKKVFVALSGLALCGFLIVHLAGNFLLFKGPEAFNGYAHGLERNPLLLPAELGLVAIFGVHILFALRVSWENRRARPERYEVFADKGGRTVASRSMIVTGLLVLGFIVVHLVNFRFADVGTYVGQHGSAQRDLHAAVVGLFGRPEYAFLYVAAVGLLGLHVSHGVQSLFRTLGFHHPRYTPIVCWISRLFGGAVAVGYAVFPVLGYWAVI
jgi:succinate dehydrogenase / fumarate reductase cytochrome b subunit